MEAAENAQDDAEGQSFLTILAKEHSHYSGFQGKDLMKFLFLSEIFFKKLQIKIFLHALGVP